MRITDPPIAMKNGIAFRQLEVTDIDAWYAYLSNPKAIEHTSWAIDSAEGLKPVIAAYLSSDESSSIRFAVSTKANGPLLGTAGFQNISAPHRTAEIAYDFAPENWGKGLATACCQALVEWGFESRRYVRIQAVALDTNLASVRVLEKCGFSLEGKLRSFRIVRGVSRDFWLYAKTAP